MIKIPKFERVVLIGDDAPLLAEISSFFRRERCYLPLSDGPRLGRHDRDNEIIRRSNLVAKVQPRRVLFAGLSVATAESQALGWPKNLASQVASKTEAVKALKGLVRPSAKEFHWGENNLGIGLMLSRKNGSTLVVDRNSSQNKIAFVGGGRHLLVACESGDELAQIIASNLAFSLGASLLIFQELTKKDQEEWLDSLYLIGSQEQSHTFKEIAAKAAAWLPDEIISTSYREILFVTNGFPWGIALPGCPTSHIYSYPDLGRSVADGIWATVDRSKSARNALLVQPGQVDGSEIEVIKKALGRNGTFTRVLAEANVTVNFVDTIIQCVPFDVMVFATHAGDWHGERITYEYLDREGQTRRLVVDEAVGFGYDPDTDLYLVQSFEHFHELDHVSWYDDESKKRLPVGSAILAWIDIPAEERRQKIVHRIDIDRVRGAMALRMYDHIWLPAIHGLPGAAAPVVLNNACSSFHQLSNRFIFAGARAYLGTLFPVSNTEAIDIASSLFLEHLGQPISKALWEAQNQVYEEQLRRPYVLVGLPFCSILPNQTSSIPYIKNELMRGVNAYRNKAKHSPHADVQRNSARLEQHLLKELRALVRAGF